MLFVSRCKDLLQRTVANLLDEVAKRLRRYDEAFLAMTAGGDPSSFRVFLAKGAGLELGDLVGRLEQVVGFWQYRFGGARISAMSPDEMLDGMRDLLQGLSISPLSARLDEPVLPAAKSAA